MSLIVHPQPQSRRNAALRDVDMWLAVLAVLWTAESLGRLPVPTLAVTLVLYAGFCSRFALHPDLMLRGLQRFAWLLPFPCLALVSAFWSPVPMVTAAAAIQLMFTMLVGLYIGLVLGIGRAVQALVIGLSLALAASAVLLVAAPAPEFAPRGGYLGVFLQKNGLGQRATLCLCLLGLWLALSRGKAMGWAALAAAIAVWMLAMSGSVTAQLAAGLCLAIGGLWPTIRRGGTLAALWLVALGCAAAALFATALILRIDLLETLLSSLGRSRDLTGRVVLWDVATLRAAADPWLGIGYMAFWQAPAHAQEVAVLRAVHGPTVATFHNFLLEIVVSVGIPGLCATAVFLMGVVRNVAQLEGGVRLWALVYVGLAGALSLLGSSLHRPHEIVMLSLVVLAVGAGTARRSA